MKNIVIVDGGKNGNAAINLIKASIENNDVKIIHVDSINEIPMNERIKLDVTNKENFQISAPHSQFDYFVDDKKKGGHKRPYKYHK